ncbi:hypothetical protein [Selenomonas sp.]|uniref:hypothetical protein n=1 Tax=Selenomonas sp. TaxID=2053611 RepID=UPI0025E72F50|nr:hypothetical protein [Selenomonas sp.]MCI6085814.1 hypothetical protein [Selenomonas sp.]MCI6284672.1 hypothetical protein [Selenomonas sp.]
MHRLPKFFNMLVQTWNTLFFLALAFGGVYFFTQGAYLWAAVLVVLGLGGAVFCLKQAQNWNEVKDEQLPKYESLKDILKKGSAANTNAQNVLNENKTEK